MRKMDEDDVWLMRTVVLYVIMALSLVFGYAVACVMRSELPVILVLVFWLVIFPTALIIYGGLRPK